MANDTSTGYASQWNVSPVPGSEIVTFSPRQFPFLARTSGIKLANSNEIAMSAQYDLETFAQPAITEAASVTAPTAIAYDRANEVNEVQIFHKAVNVTYNRQSSAGRLQLAEVGTSGLAFTNAPNANPVISELAFQSNAALEQLNGDLEVSALSGTYAKATAANVAGKMRGIVTAATTNAVAASSAKFSKVLMDQLLLSMAGNGAPLSRPVIFVNAFQKQQISNVYGYVPTDRTIGGLNIQIIETDFGVMEVVFNRNIATDALLVADMNAVYLASQIVPGKEGLYLPGGLFLLEELSKTGASEKYQMYGQLSIDYGSEKYHGKITGLATS